MPYLASSQIHLLQNNNMPRDTIYRLAQDLRGPENIKSLTNRAGDVLGPAEQGNFFVVLGQLTTVLISIAGVIMFGFILVAGFYWMTAGGDSGQVDKAKKLLVNSVIGVLLILSAYAIAQFAQEALIDRLSGDAPAPVEETVPAP